MAFALFSWWLKAVPLDILYIAHKTVQKLFSYFSIDLLFKTLLLPWKRDEINTDNLSIDLKFRVWIMNLVSRFVGAIVRLGVIFVGLCSIIFCVVVAVVATAGFITLPVIAVYLLISAFI